MSLEIPITGTPIIARNCSLAPQGQCGFLSGALSPLESGTQGSLSHPGKHPSDTPLSFLGANQTGLESTLAASGHLLWVSLDPCGWGQLTHPADHSQGKGEDRGHGPPLPGPTARSWQGGLAAVPPTS